MKILALTITILALVSCQKKKVKVKKEYVNPFQQVVEYGERIHRDTVLTKHMNDFVIPLNESMADLKEQDPEFYQECISMDNSEEMTKKLKSSKKFLAIAKKHNLDAKEIPLIEFLK
jgi:dimeric dUTPase (all-alpha-NTP-PPase superfamily)